MSAVVIPFPRRHREEERRNREEEQQQWHHLAEAVVAARRAPGEYDRSCHAIDLMHRDDRVAVLVYALQHAIHWLSPDALLSLAAEAGRLRQGMGRP